VDEVFLKQLVVNIRGQPTGDHEALFVLVKVIDKIEDLDKSKIDKYQYKVLGGTHQRAS